MKTNETHLVEVSVAVMVVVEQKSAVVLIQNVQLADLTFVVNAVD